MRIHTALKNLKIDLALSACTHITIHNKQFLNRIIKIYICFTSMSKNTAGCGKWSSPWWVQRVLCHPWRAPLPPLSQSRACRRAASWGRTTNQLRGSWAVDRWTQQKCLPFFQQGLFDGPISPSLTTNSYRELRRSTLSWWDLERCLRWSWDLSCNDKVLHGLTWSDYPTVRLWERTAGQELMEFSLHETNHCTGHETQSTLLVQANHEPTYLLSTHVDINTGIACPELSDKRCQVHEQSLTFSECLTPLVLRKSHIILIDIGSYDSSLDVSSRLNRTSKIPWISRSTLG